MLDQACDYDPFMIYIPSASQVGHIWKRKMRNGNNVLSVSYALSSIHLFIESSRAFLYEAVDIANSRSLTTDELDGPNSPFLLSLNHIVEKKGHVKLSFLIVGEDVYL